MLKPKRVLCIHDLASLGRSSLSVIVPTLAACGCQPIMLPTVLLSCHTGGLGTPVKQDSCAYSFETLESYAQRGEIFDCIYSGYLSNPQQASLVEKAFSLWPDALHVVDPVLGDNGKCYQGISHELCTAIKKLCQQADIILPNSTEAALLLDLPLLKDCLSVEEGEKLLAQLKEQYQCQVVLTGILQEETTICNLYTDLHQTSSVCSAFCNRNYPGTGDLFASAFVGKFLSGASFAQAIRIASDFVGKAVFASPSQTNYGVWYEPFLSMLTPDFQSNVLNIVLVEPRIPQNTGNIARTCAATGAKLHLVGPMGFAIDDKKLKRAGLDYWHLLDITYYKSLEEFFLKNKGTFYFFTTKAKARYCDVSYPKGAYLVFGREDAGLPEQLLVENPSSCVRMPMHSDARSLNLSNTVAIGVYEVLRQWDFPGLQTQGHLQNYEWK